MPTGTPSTMRPATRRQAGAWLLCLGCVGAANTARADPPYPPSAIIQHIAWDFDGLLTDAAGSDLWPVTWADDGNVYTAWGDGAGFPGGAVGTKVSYGFAELGGMPPAYDAADLSGFEAPDGHGKVSSLISADGVLYMTFFKQDGTLDHAMAYSTDHGRSFTECPSAMWPGSGRFFPSGLVNFGRDNQGARDGYLYAYGGKWIGTQGPADDVYLARVPAPVPGAPAQICDVGRFEYLSGPDRDSDGIFDGGSPLWSSSVGDRVAVFHDSNGVANAGGAHAVYNEPLGRYILTVSHRPAGEPLVAGVGQMGIFEGPEPWGPWRTVTYEENWGGYGNGESLGYHLATKWISGDGTTFWMTFSSTGTLDRFNLIRGILTLGVGDNFPPGNVHNLDRTDK